MTTARYAVSIERAALEARFEVVGHAAIVTAVLRSARLPIPEAPSSAASGPAGVRVVWVGPRRMIVIAPLVEQERIGAALRAAMAPGGAVAAVDVTGSTATFTLNGPGVADVLAQGCAHDLTPLYEDTRRTIMTDGWGIAALIERPEGATLLTVDATFAPYVEHMLLTAAGLPAPSKPAVMQAPPPPIRVAG